MLKTIPILVIIFPTIFKNMQVSNFMLNPLPKSSKLHSFVYCIYKKLGNKLNESNLARKCLA